MPRPRRTFVALGLVVLAACGVASLGSPDKADAAAITGAGLGTTRGTNSATWTPPPFLYTGINGDGQSLSIGFDSNVLDSGPDPFGILAVFDDAGEATGYQDAASPTLWIRNGQSPIRALATGGVVVYPTNLYGETVDHCYAYQLASYAKAVGETYPTVVLTENGISGASIAQLSVGSTSWSGAAVETQFLGNTLGAKYGMGSILWTQGEADANDISQTYGTDLGTFTANYRAMIAARTNQTYVPRLIQTMQSSSPVAQFGDLTTANATNGQSSIAQSNATILLAGAKYQYDAYYVPVGGPHLTNTGYCLLGELAARAEWDEENGTHFQPIWETSAVRSGTVVTLTYNLPAPSTAIVFDPTNGDNMHAGGPLAAYWGNQYGFEAYDQALPGTGIVLANDGTGQNEWTWSVPYGVPNGTIIYIENNHKVAASNVLCTVSVIDTTHFACLGSTFVTGTMYTTNSINPVAFAPIQISSVAITGPLTVQVTLGRLPVGSGLKMSYGYYTDLAVGTNEDTGGWIGGAGRGGALRGNAVAITGARTGIAQYDWAVNFGQLSVP